MKQLVSLVKDDQVQYALLDGDEMIPFAVIHIPEPDRFGLHEAAVLGTNLIEALNLNGRRSKRAAELPAGPPRSETAVVAPATQPRSPRRDIHLEDVVAIINEHPDGITCRQIADQLWRQLRKRGSTESWMVKGVENRINAATNKPNPPFRIEHRAEGNFKRRYLTPNPTPNN